MKKFTRILASVTAVVLSLGIAGCGYKDSDYPAFKPNGEGNENVETSEKYTVNVTSAGGLKLDGIRISAYNSAGVKVRTGMSKDGVINFNLSLGAYTLKIDETSLPAGYYLEENQVYTTNPEKRDEIDVKISSKIISQAATSSTTYSLGDIMHDFTLPDYRAEDDGYTGQKSYKLSDIFKTKKAVVLNFWYPGCTWCTREFPYLQAAYETAKSDVEVLGVCFASYTNESIAKYVAENANSFNLTFPLGRDTANLQSKFNVTGAPTTIVIDRYGMIAFSETGGQPSLSFWQELFKKYSSDNYKQELNGSIGGGDNNNGGGSSSGEREHPNVTMPSSEEMKAAAVATGVDATFRTDEDDEYAWPWMTTTDPVYGTAITTSNAGKHSSYSTVFVDIDLKKDELLSFDYTVSSEAGMDKLYVLLDGQLLNSEGWSGDIDWTSYDCYVADRDKTVTLNFIFTKDAGDVTTLPAENDCAKIKNIRTSQISANSNAIDTIRDAASGDFKEGKYAHYTDVVLGDDGFYHVNSKTGPLLYISLSNITAWSKAHTENNTFNYVYDSAEGSTYATLYEMTFYKYSEMIESEDGQTVLYFGVKIGDKDFTTALTQYYHMLDMLEKPYQLMPVSVQLKDWADAFVHQYAKEQGASSHDNEWLEFCFYYDHYGKPHTKDEVCRMDTDITQGLTIFNPFKVEFDKMPSDGDNMGVINAEVKYPLAFKNAIYYQFTAPKDGVYQIRDYDGTAMPELTVYSSSDSEDETTIIDTPESILDFDMFQGVTYGSFNNYVSLKAGETIYLQLYIEEQTTGDFTFDIIYHERIDKLMHCSTWGGGWTYDENGVYIYLGIDAAYSVANDRYYYADENGNPDLTKPIYINMAFESYFMSSLNGLNYASLKTIIDNNTFATQLDSAAQSTMVEYYKAATAKPQSDELYGLVEADSTIVNILNRLIGSAGGAGDNRGWMCFACYMEHIV